MRKGFSLPENPIFKICQNFAERAGYFCTALRAEFHAWAPSELRRRKQARNVLAFEDLLTRLDDALRGPGGATLAESIRQKYRAALVDEFQDTDPVQYSISRPHLPGKRRDRRPHRRSQTGDLRFPGRGCVYLSERGPRHPTPVHPAHELALGQRTR